jgi:ABC-2 type transport system ATP-binding protein
MITLQNLSKKYGNKQVLCNIDFTFETGKCYGIVGDNGAGKSTLFNCISGLEDFDGTIQSDYLVLKNEIAYLQAEPFFFSRMTGREYLQLICNARKIKNINIDTKNIFDLPLNEYAEHYSTGMKKKLAITAVIIQSSAIIILDEPFNGLDIQSSMIISEVIQYLKTQGHSILISSHIFSTLTDCCEEIILLSGARFEEVYKREDFHLLEQKLKTKTRESILKRLE